MTPLIHKLSTTFFYLILVLGLAACTHLSKPHEGKPHEVVVLAQFDDKKTLSFTGKGAGAGMMLMSSMGPMGIAIGVAIDEGIGKDIEKSLRADNVNFDILREVEAAFKQAVTVQKPHKGTHTTVHITVLKFGFKTAGGDHDPVSAWFEFEVTAAQPAQRLVYPGKLYDQEHTLPTLPLNVVKVNGVKSGAILRTALKDLATHWAAKSLLEN